MMRKDSFLRDVSYWNEKNSFIIGREEEESELRREEEEEESKREIERAEPGRESEKINEEKISYPNEE